MTGFQIQMKQIGADNITVCNLYPTNRDIDISIDNQMINDYKLNRSLTSSTVNGVLKYIWNKFSSYYLKDETVTTGAYSDYTNTAHAIDPDYVSTILTEETAVADKATTAGSYANMYDSANSIVTTDGKKVSDLLPISSLETSVTNLQNRSESLDSDIRILSTYLAHVINEDLQSHLSTYASTSDTSLKSSKSDNSDVATYDVWGRHIDTTYLSIDGTNYNNTPASYAKKSLQAGIVSNKSEYSIHRSIGTTSDVLGRSLTGALEHVLSGTLYLPSRNNGNTQITLGSIPYYGVKNYLFFIENIGVLFMPSSSYTSSMFMTRYKKDNSLLTVKRNNDSTTMTFTASYSSTSSFKGRFAYANTTHGDADYSIHYRIPANGTTNDMYQGSVVKPYEFITKQRMGYSGGYIYKKYECDDLHTRSYTYLYSTTSSTGTTTTEKTFTCFEAYYEYGAVMKCTDTLVLSYNDVTNNNIPTKTIAYAYENEYHDHKQGYPVNLGLQFSIFEM